MVWITGLSGTGKTTVGRLLSRHLRTSGLPAALLDGNDLRHTIARDLGYDVEDRRRCADRYARLARLLAQQGLYVVVATISMFEAIRRWNRRYAPGYVEVYLRTRVPVQPRRDRRSTSRERLVVGRDLPFEEPKKPDLVFEAHSLEPDEIARRIWLHLGRA